MYPGATEHPEQKHSTTGSVTPVYPEKSNGQTNVVYPTGTTYSGQGYYPTTTSENYGGQYAQVQHTQQTVTGYPEAMHKTETTTYAQTTYPNYNQNYPNYDKNFQQNAPVSQDMYQSYPTATVLTQTATTTYGGEFGFLGNSSRFLIKQRFEMLEALANTAGCGCVEQANKYDIFDLETGQPILHVKEKSGICMRICCKPNHTAKLMVYDVRSQPMLYQGYNQQLHKFTQDTSKYLDNRSLVMTVSKPFKCNCCACSELCLHEQKARLGPDKSRPIGSAQKVFPCGGYCVPKLDVKDSKNNVYAEVVGPCCIVGGLIELMAPINFKIVEKTEKGVNSEKVLGVIEKKKPAGTGMLQEMVGDADQFVLELHDKSLPAEKKANLLATLLLLDYMFFEGGPPIEYNHGDGSCHINCWTCYVCGCVCPCETTCGGKQSGD